MAQEGGKSEIGAVSVSIDGNIAPLQAKLEQAKKEAEDAARIINSETQRSITGRAGAVERGVAGSERSNVEAALRAERNSAADMQSMAEPVAKAGSAVDGLIGKLREAGRQSVQFLNVFTRIGLVVGVAGAAVTGLVAGVVHLFTAGERANKAFNELRKSMEASFDKFNPKAQGIRGELDEISSVVAQESDKINQARNRGEISAKRARGINNLILAREEFLQEQAIKRDALKSNLDALSQAEEARLKKNEEYFNRRMEQKKLQIEQERAIEDDAFHKAEDMASQQQDRMLDLASGARAASEKNNPLRALDNEARDQAAAIMDAWQKARDPVQQMLIQMFGAAIIGGIKAEKAQIEAALKNTIIDAVNNALAASGGTGSSAFANMTVQLSEIAAVTRAINMNIPRDSP